ncbi:Asp-tRNA(Asn)/Glu-tRNA(Gln) amidotransferase GatCAB subunit C [Candidatus Roizmanbacteria bacterium CG09_land_8_20_14_0_10_41_9]|uniref:Asp-tRNA(Asn)/Glu-tRNA(Gln) amidotransferase GatCAB subunit C n=1 Tax=Candidatus Roizmanbacteria bacterium CG09_land_8_20_14_0_10_41_9 TaxID=1974850 RepID=A0A2H0WUW0_9BACT|nr:MAG: Asp-tRNA(Asn)/Glu-tRNA(Gln) amidotransferase GatCAB subunit C [Candidatus Roizmanbacteria bacterium CG09_land_8_20_14_0_10_41_9]
MKRTLPKEEIKHLGNLSGISLTDEETKTYQKQLSETLDYMENINELPTANTPPTSNVSNLENVFFHDGGENKRGLTQNEALSNTKQKKDGKFLVKRIL